MPLRSILTLASLIAGPPASAARPLHAAVANGDIILHKSQSSQAAALRAATGSPYTHVGLVFKRGDSFQVLEAVEPVRWTALDAWVKRGEARHVVVLRLRDPSLLGDHGALAVRTAAEAYLGRPYDLLFQWSDDRIYCSELVYKAYKSAVGVEVGELTTLGAFDLSSPEVQSLIRARIKGRVDESEPVVAPSSLLVDSDLTVVYTNDPDLLVTVPPAP
jgi:hypothetical protein